MSGKGEMFGEIKSGNITNELDLLSDFKNTSLIGQETILAVVKIILNKLNGK